MLDNDAALNAWCVEHDVEVLPDYAGRPSVDLPTAYRLHAEAAEASRVSQEAFAERKAREAEAAAAEMQRRREIWQTTYDKSVARGKSERAARMDADASLAKASGGFLARRVKFS